MVEAAPTAESPDLAPAEAMFDRWVAMIRANPRTDQERARLPGKAGDLSELLVRDERGD